MFKRPLSITSYFLVSNAVTMTVFFGIFFVIVSLFSQNAIEKIFRSKLDVSQSLFVSNISQDFLIGMDSEVFRKCRQFFEKGEIQSIEIRNLVSGKEVCNLKGLNEPFSVDIQSNVFFDEGQKHLLGSVKIRYNLSQMNAVFNNVIFSALCALILIVILQFIFARKIADTFTKPIILLASKMQSSDLTAFSQVVPPSTIKEISILQEGIRQLAVHSIESQNTALLRAEIESKMQITKQVSHDIRSPLSALNMILGQLQSIPESQRVMIRNSVNRIQDIANTLLSKVKEQVEAKSTNEKLGGALQIRIELLPALIDNLVSEKRVQFRDKIGIEIQADLNNSYGAFVNIDPTELKRTISNLVNNSCEAFVNARGKIVVRVEKINNQVILTVTDNGKGIPKHVLEKLGQIGVSHGKEGTESGSGLGVYHAKKTIESFGAKFKILSTEGIGTTTTMIFPAVQAPKWFVEKLMLKPGSVLVSLDDDTSIHSIWSGRFEMLNIQANRIQHTTFASGVDFSIWVKDDDDEKSERLYLVDFELLNQKHTGLELIEILGIGSQSILVTSRYEEPALRANCERLGVRLIPKGMAGFVPMEVVKPKELFSLCLIDDDTTIIHSCWHIAAEMKNLKIRTFATPQEFFAAAPTIDTKTPIYVDVSLSNGVKGQDVAQEVYKLGFKEIYLATGYEADAIEVPPFIKRVVGKDFPDKI